MKTQLHKLEKNGATSKLWVQYFHMVCLMKEFIMAERMGNWNSHIQCIQKMIPFFHASGHFSYAKACQLYLNDMANLKNKMTVDEYAKFIDQSNFTIRRTDQFWCGNFTDMTIEQTLMRSMKTIGGLTHGRGITDATLTKWVQGLPSAHDVCETLEKYCGVYMANSDQHVDERPSRISRDESDLKKLLEWFSSHPPFPTVNNIISIATGIVGDKRVNCYKANEIGLTEMKKMIGLTYGSVTLKRSSKVLPLGIMTSSIKIRDELIPIDPLLLFQRISIMKQNDVELKTCFNYELSPYPLSLFSEGGMRKTKKSVLYDYIKPMENTNVELNYKTYVVDGGFLLHRIIWQINQTFVKICQLYVSYIEKHFGKKVTIVFDGYNESSQSTKNAERHRRIKNTSSDILFDKNMVLTIAQSSFLSNLRNKSRFINILSIDLKNNGYTVLQAADDADTMIVNEAILKANYEPDVIVVGEVIDLLVLLIALTPEEKISYF